MRIVIASDHAGFNLKESLKVYLAGKGEVVKDFGAFSSESCDYPDFAKKVAEVVSEGGADFGVLVCGSGVGMCITANRYRGVRAAVLHSAEEAELSRRHNDANVACIGARINSEKQVEKFLDAFLSTPFEGGRHQNRVDKIDRGAK